MAIVHTAWYILLLALGFGFVIFFHELGHFLAAKWQKVKVEQFAVGFGPAIVAYRKGIGFRYGTTTPEFDRRIHDRIESSDAGQLKEHETPTVDQVNRAMADLGLSETEYRLNWVPLGGYVKMLGQDDLRPDLGHDDPRAYNNKSIGGRMIIVSAGVVMNVILAAIGFMIVFLMGLRVPPAEVGGVLSNSPAARAVTADGKPRPLRVGDKFLEIGGEKELDFTKVQQSVALAAEGEPLPVKVQHADGTIDTLYITPEHPDAAGKGLLAIGVIPPPELRGPDVDEQDAYAELVKNADCYPADVLAIKPGDVITAVDGESLAPPDKGDDYWKLDRAVAKSDGKPVVVSVRGVDGTTRQITITPQFLGMFGDTNMAFAGMEPRVQVDMIQEESKARGQVRPGDVVEKIGQEGTNDTTTDPSASALMGEINANGQDGRKIVLWVRGPGEAAARVTKAMLPDVNVGTDRKGLGVGLSPEANETVVADVRVGSAAAKAGIQRRWRITSVGNKPVSNWFEVRRLILDGGEGKPVTIGANGDGQEQHVTMTLTPEEYQELADLTVTNNLLQVLHERTIIRQTKSPVVAAGWGVTETRDFILQFYLTIKRMFQGSVSVGNTMGPVGIFASGAQIAKRGYVWLIWFLSVISANLAVVNFLPIPVVDGGLFTFLVLEKIQGKPLSPNAQKIVQMVGLALILGVFLLVTYQDIARILTKS